jgi:hypothetical protein
VRAVSTCADGARLLVRVRHVHRQGKATQATSACAGQGAAANVSVLPAWAEHGPAAVSVARRRLHEGIKVKYIEMRFYTIFPLFCPLFPLTLSLIIRSRARVGQA